MNSPSRKNIRLANWDYSSNATYHVTICAANKQPLFGHVCDDGFSAKILLSDVGKAVESAIQESADNVDGLLVDNYVTMPNHVHLLLTLNNGCSLGQTVARVKSKTLRMLRAAGKYLDVWQRGYHEHIIRGEADYQAVWEYIETNPAKWAEDELYVR